MIRKFQFNSPFYLEYYVKFYRGDFIYSDSDFKYTIIDMASMKIKGCFYSESNNNLIDSIFIK